MRVHEGRRDEVPARVDHLSGGRLDLRLHCHDPVPTDPYIGHTAIGQRAAPDDQVEGHLSPLL
jgi:hypothetical protein